jgi:hypothetical protein
MRLKLVLLCTASFAVATVAACVGEDPPFASGQPDGGGSSSSSSSSSGGIGDAEKPDACASTDGGCPTCRIVAGCLASPRSLALSQDRKTLFYTTKDSRIWTLDLESEDARPEAFDVPSTSPTEMAVDDSYIFFFDTNGSLLHRMQIDGGAEAVFASTSVSGIAIDGPYVYWAKGNDPDIVRCPKAGPCTPETVSSNNNVGTEVRGVAARNNLVVWGMKSTDQALGWCDTTTTARCNYKTSSPPPYISSAHANHPGSRMVIASTPNGRVFWSAADHSGTAHAGGEILVTDTATNTTTHLAEIKGFVEGIAVDGADVYFVTNEEGSDGVLLSDANKIMKLTIPDGAIPTTPTDAGADAGLTPIVIATGVDPGRIVVTPTEVIWANRATNGEGSIVRTKK